jgi:DNA-binding transcriptional LysR family regulator
METGSVTAAASELGMTQPAASKMLRQAEERLGFALFRREHKRLVPTPEAHALLPELLGALAAIGGLERLADALRAGRSGRLTIAAVPVLATALLPQAEQAFRAERCDVSVRLRAMSALEVVNTVCRAEDGGVAAAISLCARAAFRRSAPPQDGRSHGWAGSKGRHVRDSPPDEAVGFP